MALRRVDGLGGGRPVIARAALIGSSLLVCLLVLTFSLGPLINRVLFDGQTLLLIAFALALVGYFVLSLTWGVLAGSGRFRSYALAQSGDGVFRIVICIGLALLGVHSAGPYGLVMGLTPTLAALLVFRRNSDLLEPGPPAPWRDLSRALGWLLLASVGSQLLANTSILAIKVLATHREQAEAGHFLAAVVITRIPLFLFGAVQGSLLPRLAALARAQQFVQFRSGLKRLFALVIVIGVLATVVCLAIGPELMRILFGSRYVLSADDLAILAAGSGAYMLALAIAQALIALGMHARSSVGWLIGTGVFILVTALGSSLVRRVEIGFLAGAVVAVVVPGLLLWSNWTGLELTINPDLLGISTASLEIEP